MNHADLQKMWESAAWVCNRQLWGATPAQEERAKVKLEASDSFWKILENQSGNWSLQAVTGSPCRKKLGQYSLRFYRHIQLASQMLHAGHQELRSLLGMTRLVLFTLVGHRGMLWGERFRNKADAWQMFTARMQARHARQAAEELAPWPDSRIPKP